MDDSVKIIFEGREEILRTIDAGGEIVRLLGLPQEDKCMLIDSTIRLTKKLGQGNFGKVFLIEFPGMGEKLYVVKKTKMELVVYRSKQENVEEYLQILGLDWDSIKEWQPPSFIDAWENANYYDKVSVVIPPDLCLVQNERLYPAIPKGVNYGKANIGYTTDGNSIIVPKGSYVCKNQSFSELAISIYAGKLYRDGSCINFFNTYSMFTCMAPPEKQLYFTDERYIQYTFMDKIDGELRKYNTCIAFDRYAEKSKSISNAIADGVYVQTLFAIAAYQHYYKISHNDLHTKNVFVEFVTDKTTFNGETLRDADWYHYSINNNNIYLPAIPITAKIGDYGLSIKYSKPIVGPLEVFEDGMNTNDGTGAWIPTIYMPQYDSFFFTTDYSIEVVKSRLLSNATLLFSDCLKFMCQDDQLKPLLDLGYEVSIQQRLVDNGFIKPSNLRPILSKLVNVKNATDLLLGPVLTHYGNKPSKGKIVTLGVI